jgi:S-adenosylmethionine/arginine decarboxylase-like enzyme
MDIDLLNNSGELNNILKQICIENDFQILNENIHTFHPIGCSILYLLSESHLSIHTFPEKNHISFDIFTCRQYFDNKVYIEFRILNNKILEIGGYTAVLAKRIMEELKCKYTILDIVQQPPNHTDIDYISANCETFDYNNEKTVIMSHVFEHIYNPTKLINQFIKSGVENVFISIPNMNSLLRTNNIAILHVEHTFYIDEYDIKSMFSKAGFVCSAQQYFKDHSIFFHFKKIYIYII